MLIFMVVFFIKKTHLSLEQGYFMGIQQPCETQTTFCTFISNIQAA